MGRRWSSRQAAVSVFDGRNSVLGTAGKYVADSTQSKGS